MPPGRQPFKPPRPVGSSAPNVNNPISKPSTTHQGASKAPSRAVATSKDLTALSLSSSEDERDPIPQGNDPMVVESSSPAFESLPQANAQPTSASADVAPNLQVIPPQLLSKLMHNHFQHDDTRITKEAMAVFSKYVELLVKEAVMRADFEAREKEGGDGFLEVEDLEKLAPQLLLDF